MFEKTRASNWSTAHVQFSRWSRIFMYCTIKFLPLWVNLRRVFLFLPICSLWFKPSKGKMNWYEQWEPQNSFRETVEVMRNGSYYPEVTIYYHNRGRGVFSITDGGTILWEEKDGRDRRLRVQTKYGNTIQITRRHRGGYSLNTRGFWKNELGRTYY